MPDKISDNEIIKALECCAKHSQNAHYMLTYQGEPLHLLLDNALDLINRLQAENDNYSHNNRTMTKDIFDLQKENEELRVTIKAFTDFGKLYSEIKSEAYKEFAERLKEKAMAKYKTLDNEYLYEFDNVFIDNLLKELVGE